MGHQHTLYLQTFKTEHQPLLGQHSDQLWPSHSCIGSGANSKSMSTTS